ncbi:MAG: pdxB [Gammaproteobacteria bacterium]|jgi:erythronate-4-phosphate dehydrogenase|nr:pdxB [Gammaproteobacteria bacterium]
MLIIADEEIPCSNHYFSAYGELILKPGRLLTHQDICEADILLVRSVTKINEALLHDTKVKFVGSTVTGTDHLDIAWLNKANIQWSAALGCNAIAVAEYVVTVVAALQKKGLFLKSKCRAGVVGVGRIGSQVVEKLKSLGFEVVQCDPLRAQQEKAFISTSLEEFEDLDFISLHVPLTKEPPYPTMHLIEKNFLQRQKKDCVLLNTARGSVIDFSDLIDYGKHLIWCFDVWENEPYINKAVLAGATIASPHIAGHSVQSKYRGIDMIYQAAIQQGIVTDKGIVRAVFPRTDISLAGKEIGWREVLLELYNPFEITRLMKKAFLEENDHVFDVLRKHLVRGSEFEFIQLRNAVLRVEDINQLRHLGLKVLL